MLTRTALNASRDAGRATHAAFAAISNRSIERAGFSKDEAILTTMYLHKEAM
jgi:hypothetical protein